MNTSRKQAKMQHDEVSMSRGDALRRLDYHPEYAPSNEDERDLHPKPLKKLLETLRIRRRGYALAFAIVNEASLGTERFLKALLKSGLDEHDRLTFVSTTTERSGLEVSHLLKSRDVLLTRPRERVWSDEHARGNLTHEYFDVVFCAAESDVDTSAADTLGEYASLIVVNRVGQRFFEYAHTFTDRDRPSFSFSQSAWHCTPLLTDGTSESVVEYERLASACDRGDKTECPEVNCPARFVLRLLNEEAGPEASSH